MLSIYRAIATIPGPASDCLARGTMHASVHAIAPTSWYVLRQGGWLHYRRPSDFCGQGRCMAWAAGEGMSHRIASVLGWVKKTIEDLDGEERKIHSRPGNTVMGHGRF